MPSFWFSSKHILDRKKLEPLKNPLAYSNPHMDSLSTSFTENDVLATSNGHLNSNYNEEELSVSENTVSSDKQQQQQQSQFMGNVRAPKKKVPYQIKT